jgi:CheY-like chemotaxis protein
MVTEADFRKLVKDALEHLYDPAYLATHPLLPQLETLTNANRLTRAQKLRSLLKEAIEAIRPQRNLPAHAPEWRSYRALQYRYVQGMSHGQVESELGISLRQLQRELHKGLDALAALLWEMRVTEAKSSPEAAWPEMGEVQALRNEMSQWRLAREACEVHALLDEALGMLKPLLGQPAPNLRIELPASLAPVLVDATLTRQALFQILRLALQNADGNEIHVEANARGNRVGILIHCLAGGINPLAPDWQMAQLLFEQQGGTLTAEAPAGAGARLLISLPQASPPRVLVIDDNQATHQLFERYLRPHFYEVAHAYSGPDALTQVVETPPDIIILDVMMPTVDGWQVLRGLAEDPMAAAIPVVVCSVLKEPELALSLGARAYLKKPVDRLELLATLAKIQSPAPLAGAAPPSGRQGT